MKSISDILNSLQIKEFIVKYFLISVFAISVLTGCGTTQKAVEEPQVQQLPQTEEKAAEKPSVQIIKYRVPVVLKETRKYHNGEIDIYSVFEYENGTDNMISCTTYDSADEITEIIRAERSENIEKNYYYNSSNDLIKTKIITKDSSGNIIEEQLIDSKDSQITRSEYTYAGTLKEKWSIFDSNNALLAYNTYIYDEKGNNTEIKSFSPSGKMEEYFINEFNDNGNIVSVKHFSSDEKLMDSSSHIYKNGFISEESFYKGEKSLQMKKNYSYNEDNTVQICKVSVSGGQIIEILEKEFFFIEKEKTIIE